MKQPISKRPIARSGRVILGIFFSVFLVAGLALGYFAFIRPIMRIVDARGWTAVPCDIVSSEVREHAGDDGTSYSIAVRYRYQVAGATYVGNRYKFMGGSTSGRAAKAKIVRRLPPGFTATCWVNPRDANEAVIERGFTRDLWFGFIPLLFALIGGGGLYAAVAGRRTILLSVVPGLPDPNHAAIAVAAGSRAGLTPLRMRHTRHARLYGLLFFAALWNGIVATFVWDLADGWSRHAFNWVNAVFLVPFLLIGAGLIVAVIWHLMLLANPRPVLTVSAPALELGGELKLRWTIDGAAHKLRNFRIELEGREEATYTRGTDSRTDTHVFERITIADQQAPVPAQGWAKLRVPAGTMHSLDAHNNKIVWLLRVHGEVPQWPDSNDEFPVTVAPPR